MDRSSSWCGWRLAVLPALAHARRTPKRCAASAEQLRRQQQEYQKTIEALERAPEASGNAERACRHPADGAGAAGGSRDAGARRPGGGRGGGAARGHAGGAGAGRSTGELTVGARVCSVPASRSPSISSVAPASSCSTWASTGDFVGNLTQRNVQKAQDGTFSGRENRFFPREVELSLFGQIDPYARADVRIEAGEEAPGRGYGREPGRGDRSRCWRCRGARRPLGQMRNRYGWSNVIHEHDLPWVDRPGRVSHLLRRGWAGRARAARRRWVPDSFRSISRSWAASFNGDNETAFGYGRLTAPLVTGRVRAFFDLTDTMALQVGTSVASERTPRPAAQHAGRRPT